jgi:hypothetical protein
MIGPLSLDFGHRWLNRSCFAYLFLALLYPLVLALPEFFGKGGETWQAAWIWALNGGAARALAFSPFEGLVLALKRHFGDGRELALYRHFLAFWWLGGVAVLLVALSCLFSFHVREAVERTLPKGRYLAVESLLALLLFAGCAAALFSVDVWLIPVTRQAALIAGAGMGALMVVGVGSIVRLGSLAAIFFASPGMFRQRIYANIHAASHAPRPHGGGAFECSHCGAAIEAAAFWGGIEVDCPACGKPTTLTNFTTQSRDYALTYGEFTQLLANSEFRHDVIPVLCRLLDCRIEETQEGRLSLCDSAGQPVPLTKAHLALQTDRNQQWWVYGRAMSLWR